MMKKLCACLFIFALLPQLKAQSPADLLADWGNRSPIEKIYLHFDRENYIAGETAFFKGYLSSDYLPDTISTVLYLELLRDSATVIDRKALPILFGTTNGSFDLPDSLHAGNYLVRAWTASQLNHDPGFVYSKSIVIFGRRETGSYTVPPADIRVSFFPESGNFIAGLPNTVAVKVTNERGLPADFHGIVYDGDDKKVAEFKTIHDGMGLFELQPGTGTYYVISAGESGGKKHYLPEVTPSGSVLSTVPHPQGHFYEIRSNQQDPFLKPAFIVGQMQHHLVFRKELKSAKDLSGLIKTTLLRSGILQVTLFTANGLPLAERLCFVNNREYLQDAVIVSDTLNKNAKSRNKIQVHLKDTVQGSFSISVIDPDFSLAPVREESIISRFLLSSDLKGYVHQPAWYFRNDDETTKEALDVLMMTHGWRRFSWRSIPASVPPAIKDPGFIRFSGNITLRDTRKPFSEKPLLVYIESSDSARSMQMITTDAQGRFMLDSLLFFGQARVMFSDPRGKKGLFIDARLDGDSLHRPYDLPPATTAVNRYELIARATQSVISSEYELLKEGKGLLLESVVVKARTKSPLQELEERYARGMFSGMSERSIDLTNNTEAMTYSNIFDYLQFRVPGLQIISEGAEYLVYYRQGPSVSSMGDIPMTLYVNEIEADASLVATLHASEVALIKIYSSFVGASGNGAGGVLAIWTKKGSDLFDASSGRSSNLRYTGFSIIREFYSPDYDVNPSEKSKQDRRITLQWKPDIMVSGVNPKIPVIFYNNDRTKKFRVVVEGMTVDGKLLSIEKDL